MNRSLSVVLAIAAFGSALNRSAVAQDAPQLVAVPGAVQWQRIRVKNVTAELIAYWLDAEHHMTKYGQGAQPTWATGKTDAEVKAMLSLPEGVRAVAPVDGQNDLWVLGTSEGVRQVAEKVALLDRPLQQVEVEAQCIQISVADAKTLGIDFSKGQKEGKIEVGLAGAGIQQKIAALVAQKKARIITAPRVTAIFGAQSSLLSTTRSSTVIGSNNRGGVQVQPFAKAISAQKSPYWLATTTSIGFSVLPTFNPDNSMTLQIGPLRTLGISTFQPRLDNKFEDLSRRTSDIDLDGIPTRPITLKEGQIAVLRGLSWPISFKGENYSLDYLNTPASNVIVVITPRRLRRAGDADYTSVALTR